MVERLTKKVDKIWNECNGDEKKFDRRIDSEIDVQEVLTIGLMPVNSQLRNTILGCFIREKKKKDEIEKLNKKVKEDELVPVQVHGGGKCKITIFMTKEAVEKERNG